jgi:lipase
VRLYAHEWGDAISPAVVCLHGVASHGGHFARLAAQLRGFRVVAPDLRGHGRSGWEPPWGIGCQLDDILETVDAAGIERADWMGHSFGGRLVLELAVRYPERVGRAVLLDPAIRIRPDIARALADDARLERSFRAPDEAVPPPFVGRLFATPTEQFDEERRQHLEPFAGGFRWRYSASAAVAILGELAAWGPIPEEFSGPVLLVRGRQESVVGSRQLERLRRALRGRLEVVEVPGGHVVLWDAFAQTAGAIVRFLDGA